MTTGMKCITRFSEETTKKTGIVFRRFLLGLRREGYDSPLACHLFWIFEEIAEADLPPGLPPQESVNDKVWVVGMGGGPVYQIGDAKDAVSATEQSSERPQTYSGIDIYAVFSDPAVARAFARERYLPKVEEWEVL